MKYGWTTKATRPDSTVPADDTYALCGPGFEDERRPTIGTSNNRNAAIIQLIFFLVVLRVHWHSPSSLTRAAAAAGWLLLLQLARALQGGERENGKRVLTESSGAVYSHMMSGWRTGGAGTLAPNTTTTHHVARSAMQSMCAAGWYI